MTRRHFFEQASFGIGGLALASLMDGVLFAEAQGPASSPLPLHFAPKVKRVIYLFMRYTLGREPGVDGLSRRLESTKNTKAL